MGTLSRRVCVFRLVTHGWIGTRQSLVQGHFHLFKTAASETMIRAVQPSYMLTSLSSKIDMYPASGNLLLLRRDWSASAGTMSTVQAGSRTGGCSFAIYVPSWRHPSATKKTLVEGWIVWMNGSPILPALQVQAVYHADEEMLLFNTPCLSSVSVWIALWAVCPAGMSKVTCCCSRRGLLRQHAGDEVWDIKHAVSVVWSWYSTG